MREIPCALSDNMLGIQREFTLALAGDSRLSVEVRQAAIVLLNYYGAVADYRAWEKAQRDEWSTPCVYGNDCSYCDGG